jgi:hypothetical protein
MVRIDVGVICVNPESSRKRSVSRRSKSGPIIGHASPIGGYRRSPEDHRSPTEPDRTGGEEHRSSRPQRGPREGRSELPKEDRSRVNVRRSLSKLHWKHSELRDRLYAGPRHFQHPPGHHSARSRRQRGVRRTGQSVAAMRSIEAFEWSAGRSSVEIQGDAVENFLAVVCRAITAGCRAVCATSKAAHIIYAPNRSPAKKSFAIAGRLTRSTRRLLRPRRVGVLRLLRHPIVKAGDG